MSEAINHHPVICDHERTDGKANSSAAIIHSQSVNTKESHGPYGCDSAKKIKGWKQHAIVDTDGRVLVRQAYPAEVEDGDEVIPLLQSSCRHIPFAQPAFADSVYASERVSGATCTAIKVVRKLADQTGSHILPRR